MFKRIDKNWKMIKDENELVELKRGSEFGKFLLLIYTGEFNFLILFNQK